MHWEAHKKKPSSAVQRRQQAGASLHDLEIVAAAALSSPQSGNSSDRFLAALEVDDPMLDISRLAGWLTQIPERLGANELLDKAALAFLDAFDCLQSDAQISAASPAYAVAMECLESALKDQHHAKSPNPLAAIFMLSMAQASADFFLEERRAPITKVKIWQCVESIINPSLVLDSRCLQSLKYKAGPYPPLNEEDGQAIESLDLPFLLRLSHFLRAPDEHREEIRNSYARLKVEWPFTRRRYRYISGICKIPGIDRSCLVPAEVQLGAAYTVILGAALVLNACLLAMDPTDANLERDALEMGSEAIEASRKLLMDLPKGVWLAPVALFASWIATDDPDITCSFFSIIKECNQYWAEPAYMELAKALKKRILQLRANAVMEQGPRGFRDFRKVVYVRHGEGLRYALVAARSTAESPLRTDLLDATHGAAPFISPVSSVYQAERTLFYLLTVIPGGGNLFVHLQRERRFTEARVRKYGAQLICALEWLHSNNTVACLHPEIVMLDCFDHICLCASAAFILGAEATPVGCLAPELSEGLPRTKMADWWDLGILLYEMLTGLPPLLSCAGQDGRKKNGGDNLSFPGYLSTSARELLSMLLHPDPEKRLGARGAQEILSSSFFQSIACQECANRDTNVFRSSSHDDVLTLEPEDEHRPFRFPERRASQGVVYEKECVGPISFWRSFGVMMSEEARAIYSSPTPPDTAWHIVWDDMAADFRFSNSVTGEALLSSEQAELCGLEQLESILSWWNLQLSKLGASESCYIPRYIYSPPNSPLAKSCAPFQLTRALAVALKMQCSAEMICQILDRGADLDTIVLTWLETYDTYLMPEPHLQEDIPVTPLEWAIEHQRMDLVDLFLERGADINFAGYPQHGPPLVTAVLRRNLALVRRLAGKTERCAATRALCLAVEQEDRPMVEALLASSVRCEYEDPKWPQRQDYYGGIFGPDPRLKGDSHFTPPLARAVRLGNMELVRLLLAHGADPNVAYHNICRGHPRQARELHLPQPQYSCGRPVYLAAELKFDEIVEVLIRGGADIHLQHPRAVEVQGPFEYYMPHKCLVVARSVHLDVFSRLEAELCRIKKNNLER
ncbi:hypothetical protein MY3296_008180 [Beauveria thailandica]